MAKPVEEVKALILSLSRNPKTRGGFLQMRGLLRFASSDAFQDENFCKAAVSALEKFLEQEGYKLPEKLRVSAAQKATREVMLMMFRRDWSKVSFGEGGKEIFLEALGEVRNYLVSEEKDGTFCKKLEDLFTYISSVPT